MTEAQQLVWRQIKIERDLRESYGGVQVAGKWFHTDTKSRIKYMGLLSLGGSLPAGLQWKTMDGSFVTMTPQLAGQLFGAVVSFDSNLFAMAEQHRVAMLALQTPGDYVFSSGWPEKFEG